MVLKIIQNLHPYVNPIFLNVAWSNQQELYDEDEPHRFSIGNSFNSYLSAALRCCARARAVFSRVRIVPWYVSHG